MLSSQLFPQKGDFSEKGWNYFPFDGNAVVEVPCKFVKHTHYIPPTYSPLPSIGQHMSYPSLSWPESDNGALNSSEQTLLPEFYESHINFK
jgi:hypothetical protein